LKKSSHRPALRAALFVTSLLLSLLAVEFVVSLSGFRYSPLHIELQGGAVDWRYRHAFEDDHFEFDSAQIWRPRAGEKVFNGQGFRGREVTASAGPGELRVLALGDSNTLGWGAAPHHWPGYLEEELERAGLHVGVMNAGVWGHSSYQGVARLDAYLSFEPDVVLISYGANDAHRVRVSDAAYVEQVARSPLRRFLYRHPFGVGQLVLAALDALDGRGAGAQGRELVFRVGPDEYRANLGRMVQRSRARGARVYLLTRPYVGESASELWWKTFAPLYREATHDVGRELDVPVIDVYELFAGRARDFADESHFSEEGHRRAARLIGERIAPELAARPGRRPGGSVNSGPRGP
jgi:lysophospholipase L1-like esterase